MALFRVQSRMRSMSTGVEQVVSQEVEADNEVVAAERAGLRASRGHGRMVLVETVSIERLGDDPPSGPGLPGCGSLDGHL